MIQDLLLFHSSLNIEIMNSKEERKSSTDCDNTASSGTSTYSQSSISHLMYLLERRILSLKLLLSKKLKTSSLKSDRLWPREKNFLK
jgi:hypothetical protein